MLASVMILYTSSSFGGDRRLQFPEPNGHWKEDKLAIVSLVLATQAIALLVVLSIS
jgi:hypothetical protein